MLTPAFGASIFRTDEADVKPLQTISDSVTSKIADENPHRLYLHINNDNDTKSLWIKLQPAAKDNDKKGIYIDARSSWTMPTDNIYTGEISAITDSGGTCDCYVTEY